MAGLQVAVSAALGGIERIEGDVGVADFPRHTHATYALGVIESGINRTFFAGAWHEAAPGQLCAVTLGEPHAVEPVDGAGFVYRCLYPTAAQLAAAAGADAESRADAPLALPPVIDDPTLATLVRRFSAAADAAAPLLAQEELLAACLERALRHAAVRPVPSRAGRVARAVGRARAILAASLASPPSLSELAAAVAMNPFHLTRAFRARAGMPPHAFVVQLRIERARDLLRDGVALSEVAAALGFADQAHLTRQFRSRVGVTPGVYAQAVARRVA